MQFVLIKTTVRPVENAFLLMPTYEKEEIARKLKRKLHSLLKHRLITFTR